MNENNKIGFKKILIAIIAILLIAFVTNTNFIAKPIPKQTQIELEVIDEINNIK